MPTSSYVTFTLVIDSDHVSIAKHCIHSDGSITWRIDTNGEGAKSVYIQTNTVAQLKAFAAALVTEAEFMEAGETA